MDNKPNLVIIHPPGTLHEYPFDIPQYRKSYSDFMKHAERYFAVYYVRGKKTYLGQGGFRKGFRFHKGAFTPHYEPIYARIIYNKTTLYANGGRSWNIVNKWRLYQITHDKWKSYTIFKKFMKPTYRIKSRNDFNTALKKIRTPIAVFKPIKGTEGKGIVIKPKRIMTRYMKKYDGILQEFIDTSQGIPGIHRTLHDMRILIMDGKIIQTYIRIPKKGSYRANIARGGHMKEIEKKNLPQTIKPIINAIDKRFKRYGHRIYAVDFGFENGIPYLIEINPQPGLPYPEWPRYYKTWHRELIRTLRAATPTT